MFLVFNNKEDCQKYLDRVHNWLLANCPNYNASCWDVPRETKDGKFFTQLPQEYRPKEFYKDSAKIIPDCKSEFQKGTETDEQPELSTTIDKDSFPVN